MQCVLVQLRWLAQQCFQLTGSSRLSIVWPTNEPIWTNVINPSSAEGASMLSRRNNLGLVFAIAVVTLLVAACGGPTKSTLPHYSGLGNQPTQYTSAITEQSSLCGSYDAVVAADHPYAWWHLNDSGGTAADVEGVAPGDVYGLSQGAVYENQEPGPLGSCDSGMDFLCNSYYPHSDPICGAIIFNDLTSITGELAPRMGSWTIQLWFRTDTSSCVPGTDPASTGCDLWRSAQSGLGSGIQLTSTGAIRGFLYEPPEPGEVLDEITSPSNINYADGIWHDVVLVRATANGKGTLTLYIDGHIVGSPVATTTDQTLEPTGSVQYVNMAEEGSGYYNYTGELSEVAFYKGPSGALSGSQVAQQYQTTQTALYTWGDNGYGELGRGTPPPSNNSTPQLTQLAQGVAPVAISTGGGDESFSSSEPFVGSHALAIGSDGKLYAWGDNAYGEIGDNTSTGPDHCGHFPCAATPQPVKLPGGVLPVAVSAGTTFSLVIGNDGNIYSWGDDSSGQLGLASSSPLQMCGTYKCSTYPQKVNLPSQTGTSADATAISAGGGFALAIANGGHIYSWGTNKFGELGNDTTRNESQPTPITLGANPGATAVDVEASMSHWGYSLALDSNGNVWAWGDNELGELGNNTKQQEDTPVEISLSPPGSPPVSATAISAGGGFNSLAIGSDNQLYTWGWVGGTSRAPVVVTTPQVASLAPNVSPVAISSGGYRNPDLAIGSNNQVYSGYFGSGTAPADVGICAVEVSTGGYFQSHLATEVGC